MFGMARMGIIYQSAVNVFWLFLSVIRTVRLHP